LSGRKVVYYTAKKIPREPGYRYVRYGDSFTNWHYRCAKEFVEGKAAR
jgi:hypothetical protein